VELKRKVLSYWWNARSDSEAMIIGGSSFHALAAAVGKAQLPSVVWRVDGTTGNTVGQKEIR